MPIVFLVAIAVLILPHPARADIMGSLVGLINYVVMAIDQLLGAIFALLTDVLIFVSQYNNFTNEPAIATAWVLLRDIANMGFVVIIVIVGFGQMFDLGKLNGNLKGLSLGSFLPKLVIGVLLINFSKGIVGLLIDLSQIITLTFVAAFKDVAASNLIGGLQLGKIYAAGASSGEQINMFFLLMMIMIIMAIAIIIVAMITALFVTRIVAFWLLTIFSPLMFAASVYPVSKLQGYYHEWWKKFGGYLVMGPSLAFMVWLAFLILQNTSSIGVIGAKPTAMAEPTVAGQYVANAAQLSTDSAEYNNLKASSSNPTQSPIPGLDFTTLLGFVMGAGALVSTIFVAQMSKVAGSKEIGGAAMGALKKTGSYAAAGVGRAGAMARGAALGGTSAVLNKYARKEEFDVRAKEGDLKDEEGFKIDKDGKRIKEMRSVGMLGQLSTVSGTIAKEGFVKTGKDKAQNVRDWWNAKGHIRKSVEKSQKKIAEGNAGIWDSIKGYGFGAAIEKSTAVKEAEKKRKEEFEKDAVDMKNQKKGLEAKSHQDASTMAAGAKTSGEKAAIATGVINNKDLWDKLSVEQKKYWYQELKKHGDNFDSKSVTGDLNMSKLLNQELLSPDEKKELFKNLKPAETLNMLSAKIRKAQRAMDDGEDVELNKATIEKAFKAFEDYSKQENEQGNPIVNRKQKYGFLDKNIRGEDYKDSDNNIDEKKFATDTINLSAKDRDALYWKTFTRGNPKERQMEVDDFNRRNADILGASNEAAKKAEEEREIKRQAAASDNVKASLASAPDEAAQVKIAANGLENGDMATMQATINEVNLNVLNKAVMEGNANNWDSRGIPKILETVLGNENLQHQEVMAVMNKIAQRKDAVLPQEMKSAQDLIQVASISHKQLSNLDSKGQKEYQELVGSLLQESTLVGGSDGLKKFIDQLPDHQRPVFEKMADDLRANLKQGAKISESLKSQKTTKKNK